MTPERVLAGRYRLVRPIARGGMAEVWEGHDEVLARPVAIKVLHAHLARDPGFAERFRREAVAAARLAHHNIVATYDAGTDGDTAFIVMELVPGKTLREAIERSATLDPAAAAAIAAEVADALDCAHRNGLVHRDVKPGNILLADTPGTAQWRVKVVDFGIARLEAEAGGELTQPGAVIGTAKYLSPEQVKGATPDARSDVYALGVCLYEMLCGRPPFSADTELATALQHVQGEFPPPRQVVAGIPKPLEAVVLKAMARDPNDRYQSAAELRVAIGAVDFGADDAEPLVIRDVTPPSGIAPLPRRPSRSLVPVFVFTLLTVGAVAVAALVLGGDSDDPPPAAPRSASPAARPLAVERAASFDPQGDGDENTDQVGLALDGNRSTAWSSHRYRGADFANLKDGVGLVVQLKAPARIAELKALSPVRGWAASVYVGDRSFTRLDQWGAPVAQRAEIDGDVTFDLGNRSGLAVLLWITDPGDEHRAEITDLVLSGS